MDDLCSVRVLVGFFFEHHAFLRALRLQMPVHIRGVGVRCGIWCVACDVEGSGYMLVLFFAFRVLCARAVQLFYRRPGFARDEPTTTIGMALSGEPTAEMPRTPLRQHASAAHVQSPAPQLSSSFDVNYMHPHHFTTPHGSQVSLPTSPQVRHLLVCFFNLRVFIKE